LAEADAFADLGLERRAALWAIRGVRDEVLPLFAAADEGRAPQPEIVEPAVSIIPMPAGRTVVEDYASVGLTLRQHPVAFPRGELQPRGIIPCADLLMARDGQRLVVAGLVLVRPRPGTATGVIFITLEDETGIANLIVWSSLFEKRRRIVLSASMLGCRGRVQREGDVIHVVAEQLEDLSHLLRIVGNRQQPFPAPQGRGDGVTHPNGPDPREMGAHANGSQGGLEDVGRHKSIRVPTRSFR